MTKDEIQIERLEKMARDMGYPPKCLACFGTGQTRCAVVGPPDAVISDCIHCKGTGKKIDKHL